MSQYGQPKQKDTQVLIVCALAIETQNQLDDYDVLYTGVGKVNATYELTTHFGKIEVVDMEAYALAKVCYLRDVPFVSFKYITDGADEQAHEDWEANLADGIEVFKDKVLSEIKR